MPTTVILGAGIIGLSTAHSLTRIAPPDHSIHIVEPAPELFSSASGKAAGFVAKDWFAPAIAPLGALSFELHRALADKHGGRGRWGYSESISYFLDHAYQSDGLSPPTSDASTSPLTSTASVASSVSSSAIASQSTTSASHGNNLPDPLASADAAASSIPNPGPDSNSPRTADAPYDGPTGRNGSQGQGGLDWLLSNTSRAAVAGVTDPLQKTQSADNFPPWLLAKPEALEAISDRKSTAQVIPRRLCEFLLEQCLAAGVILHHAARATSFVRDERDPDGVTRLRIEYSAPQESLESSEGRLKVVDVLCENVVIAAGCWTPQVYATLFPNASRMPRITHLAGYSVTLKTKQWPRTVVPSGSEPDSGSMHNPAILSSDTPPSVDHSASPGGTTSPCHAVFTDTTGFAPEIFSRANGDVWLGGLNPPHATLPKLPNEAYVDPAEIDRLLAVGHALCGEDIEVTGQALCFRPVSATGRPIIARMPEEDLGDGLKPHGLDGHGGVFVATGHGPWGIALSLGTGQVVAEMVLGRETSADVEHLSRW